MTKSTTEIALVIGSALAVVLTIFFVLLIPMCAMWVVGREACWLFPQGSVCEVMIESGGYKP